MQVTETRKRVLGDEHPDALSSAAALAGWIDINLLRKFQHPRIVIIYSTS